MPVASSIPYIGSAFKNTKEERNELMTFVLVQPEIMQSGNADDAATARQTGDNDAQR